MHSKALAHQALCRTEEPRMPASKYTPGQSPRAVLAAQEHTVSTGPSSPPLGAWRGGEAQNAVVGFQPPSSS